ncbi:unnamed protein product [Rhizophagus irregularis]|nr:unnamed protein product [Rhizophagus irregularis]
MDKFQSYTGFDFWFLGFGYMDFDFWLDFGYMGFSFQLLGFEYMGFDFCFHFILNKSGFTLNFSLGFSFGLLLNGFLFRTFVR